MRMTQQLARAAAQDAGNRNMKANGRTVWNDEDWNAACDEFNRLWPEENDAR